MAGTPMTSGKARVFIISGRARGDHAPSYEYSLRVTGPSQGQGDVTRIAEPDPSRYDSWRDAGETRGAVERASATLEGHYARDILSTLLSLARKKCAFDVQLHFGACQDPRIFNVWDKVMILENAYATSWGAGDLGALSEDDNAVVDETTEISAKDLYEVGALALAAKAASIVAYEVLDVVVADYLQCGDCGNVSDGCQKVYAVSKATAGSPGTPPDIIYSIDGGANWYAHDIDTLTAAQNGDGVDVIGLYVVVISQEGNRLLYALSSQFDGITDPTFTAVTTGFVTGKKPTSIWSFGNGAYISAESGYVYKVGSNPSDGVTVVEAANLTTNWLLDIEGLSEDFVVAVGNNGTIIKSEDGGTTWTQVVSTSFGVGTNLNCIAVLSKYVWWVGTNTGYLYYTTNGGTTWTSKTFSGSGAGRIDDIAFSTPSVGYLAHATATPAGRILRTLDGGYSWYILPETSGSIPANDRINNLAVCTLNPNFVVGVGLADDASDGIIVLGGSA